jgi:hypothetical protein
MNPSDFVELDVRIFDFTPAEGAPFFGFALAAIVIWFIARV